MDEPATEEITTRRAGRFCVGLAIMMFSALLAWGGFALSTEDFYADWWQGWEEARGRLAGNPGLAVVMVVSAAFAGLGIWCMSRGITKK
jgi:hypothetical protein